MNPSPTDPSSRLRTDGGPNTSTPHAPLPSAADLEALARQEGRLVAPPRQARLEAEARKSWDLFYKRNETRFYKDRHWTFREFSELARCSQSMQQLDRKLTILEVGCGVGNFLFPVLEESAAEVFFYACDFSPRAIDLVKSHRLYDARRCHAFVADVTCDTLADTVPSESVDFVTLIFVLSAVHPHKMGAVLRNIYAVLRPGGSLLLRDYGVNDHAMFRFAPGSKLSDRLYVRQDNTRVYYFSTEDLQGLAAQTGFLPSQLGYVLRQTVNHKQGLSVPRVFVQGTFTKPSTIQPTGS